jgi:tRNA uridine 5-carboxymethylaminomethyl modification enzyme
LLLRQDNADLRLTEIGYSVGLVSEQRYNKFIKRKSDIEEELQRIKNLQITGKKEVVDYLFSLDSAELKKPVSFYELIKRPELDYFRISELDKDRPDIPEDVKEQVNIISKYEGYIEKQLEQVAQFKKFENKTLPNDFDYAEIKGLRIEAQQKLNKIKPFSVGQASRISGVSPADISVLLIFLEQNKRKSNEN